MSPRPAAPSSASISAWASTSPSEWPARPRGESIATPPRTRGTPASNACASIPIPTRWSDKRERLRQLVERLDADVGLVGTVLDERPRPTPKMHGDEAGRARRHDVVVDAVADVGDLARGEARLGAEALEDALVILAARNRGPERGPDHVRRDAEPPSVLAPVARLVDERLAHVEEDRLHSHDSISSKSDGSVAFSSRGSPGTTFTRPPACSTSEAQSLASPAAAERRIEATNACGVCTATRSSRGTVSTTVSSRTRFTVSTIGRPGMTPSQPSPSGSRTRPPTPSVTSGLAPSWASTAAAS